MNINMNINKLLLFNINTIKTYLFTNAQYINLEIEYNRYIIFKELIKTIENILIIDYNNTTTSTSINTRAHTPPKYKSDNINHKIYENKNIIDRFILECINYGITNDKCDIQTELQTDIKNNTGDARDAKDAKYIMDNYDTTASMDNLKHYLFFNTCLHNVNTLRHSIYFKKMILEYNEKHFKITQTMLIQLENSFITAQAKFTVMNKHTYTNIKQLLLPLSVTPTTTTAPSPITTPITTPSPIPTTPTTSIFKPVCSINHDIHNNYIIKYRTYTKTLNFNRYSKLINNYNRPFPYDIIIMLLRNSLFDDSNQQWSIGIHLYDTISILFDISFEMFASPLNFNMNMFCSLFLDTDKTFGSFGSFYNLTYDKLLNQNIKGVFYNPPYSPILMENTIKICLTLLSNMDTTNIDFTIVSFLPNWSDAIYIKEFLQSPYLVDCKIIKKHNYVLQEKDKGKIITGTFDLLFIILNSKKKQWNTERTQTMNTHIDDIVLLMKQETLALHTTYTTHSIKNQIHK